ncbi:MAG: biotin--[acetyl-CoA-carboxylase] ligase [Chloroflexi bacterium]|nr:biotin--[acetyl-CoA-carboxylase] ligase [Chloroflexota bacterium]
MNEDVLSAGTIAGGLGTRLIGQQVLYYPSVASTMDIAREEALRRATEGTVVIAGEQTGGRGRLQRAWLTPKGNIALSVVLYPSLSAVPSLIMLASLAVVGSIRNVTGLDPRIKWPNDVLLNGRKTCGILVEGDVRSDTVNHAIIGIGVNVNLRPDDFPEIQATATSLSHEAGRPVSPLAVVKSLLAEMDRLYLDLNRGASLYEEWRDRLVTLGQKVRVTARNLTFDGIAESVGKDGSLTVRRTDGSAVTVVAGDVTLHG